MIQDENHFHTTLWSEFHQVHTTDDVRRQVAVDALSHRYWKPVYHFLRRKGINHSDASDLTQGFFQEVILEKHLFQHADQSKGRFRTYLLCSLQRYVVNQHRKNTARKRMPEHSIASLEVSEMQGLTTSPSSVSPEQAFQYAWAVGMLDQTLETLEREYCADGRAVYWLVFQERVVLPLLQSTPAPPLYEICQKHGIDSEKKVSNMIVTVKRRFQNILRRFLSETMESDSCVEDELAELITILGQAGAASCSI